MGQAYARAMPIGELNESQKREAKTTKIETIESNGRKSLVARRVGEMDRASDPPEASRQPTKKQVRTTSSVKLAHAQNAKPDFEAQCRNLRLASRALPQTEGLCCCCDNKFEVPLVKTTKCGQLMAMIRLQREAIISSTKEHADRNEGWIFQGPEMAKGNLQVGSGRTIVHIGPECTIEAKSEQQRGAPRRPKLRLKSIRWDAAEGSPARGENSVPDRTGETKKGCENAIIKPEGAREYLATCADLYKQALESRRPDAKQADCLQTQQLPPVSLVSSVPMLNESVPDSGGGISAKGTDEMGIAPSRHHQGEGGQENLQSASGNAEAAHDTKPSTRCTRTVAGVEDRECGEANADNVAICVDAPKEISTREAGRESEFREDKTGGLPCGRLEDFICANIGSGRTTTTTSEKNRNKLDGKEKRKSSNHVNCRSGERHEELSGPHQDQRQEQRKQKQGEQQYQASDESKLAYGHNKQRHLDCAHKEQRHLAWGELAIKYGRMKRKGQKLVPQGQINAPDGEGPPAGQSSRQSGSTPSQGVYSRASRLKDSCFCHIMCALLQTIFPILGSFKNYSLPGDLLTDFAAGSTVAILHIPQGMAYGLLSGVEPIYGLYVSFIPVLVMSFMSKSRHASYGTFAIISMLLVNTIQKARAGMQEEQFKIPASAGGGGISNATTRSGQIATPLVITNNHKPLEGAQHEQEDSLLRNLIGQATQTNELAGTGEQVSPGQNYLLDATTLTDSFVMPTNIEILTCVCIVCGIVHITMSLLRLGVLSLMFSDQLISSFTTAGAVHVLTSQLAGLFDLDLPPIQEELFKCMRIWWQFMRALVYDGFNQTTAILSLASILFLLLIKELIEPRLRARFTRLTCLPSELVLMSIVTCCSSYLNLEANYKVKVVGFVPSGLPEPKAPRLELVPFVLKDAISIALITFAMNLSIAQVYAKKFRYELNANQELFALGTANIISSFFSCFPCASSLSRSSVQSNLNVRSQLCSLFSCCIVVTIICYFAHILHDLPKSTLSCIIVVALKGILMQLRDLYDNWRLSKLDALVWIFTFVSVIVFGVTFGLVLGIVASIFMIFLRLLTPNHSILARLPGTQIFVDKEAFAECEEIEHVKIFRFNSALCYLNRTMLKSKIEKLLPSVFEPRGFRAICTQFHARQHPFYESTISERHRVNHLIIDCSALSYCDYSGATTLVELIEDLETQKVGVYLAACPLKLIDMLEKIQSQKEILGRNVYPSISDALAQIQYLRNELIVSTCQGKSKNSFSVIAGQELTSSSDSHGHCCEPVRAACDEEHKAKGQLNSSVPKCP